MSFDFKKLLFGLTFNDKKDNECIAIFKIYNFQNAEKKDKEVIPQIRQVSDFTDSSITKETVSCSL
jgi:hypothetical protein